MKTVFFLQNNHVIYNTIPVARFAWSKGIEIIDRSSPVNLADCGVDWSQYDLIIPYGSVQFNRLISESPLHTHLNYNEKCFRTDEWVGEFGNLSLNGQGWSSNVEYLKSDIRWERNKFELHIRPNSLDKAFDAKVFVFGEWLEQAKKLDKNLRLFVSPVKKLEAEYRCWCVHGKIVEVSQYMKDGEFNKERLDAKGFVGGFAQALVDFYRPFETVVIDIAKTPNGYKFIEFNSFHASGWYAADVPTILEAYIDGYIQTPT